MYAGLIQTTIDYNRLTKKFVIDERRFFSILIDISYYFRCNVISVTNFPILFLFFPFQEDMVCLSCTATGERVCLAAEGFGNRHCFLENIADKNIPPDLSQCVFVIEQALSVRALQELVTASGSETVSILAAI